MNKLIKKILGEYSQWIDVGGFDLDGYYYILQMKYNLKTNKKKFRRARMGFINDYQAKQNIYKNSMSYSI